MSTLTALLFLIGFFELATSIAILRAAPDRYDNRVFATMGFVEAGLQMFRGFTTLEGGTLLDTICLRGDLVASIALSYLTLCFAWSFPFSRRPPPGFLVPALASSLVALALSLHPTTAVWFVKRSSLVFFGPVFVLTLYLLWRNSQRLTRRDPLGIPLVMIALAFRWAFAMLTYNVGRESGEGTFRALAEINATGAMLAGQILMAYAILKSNVFRLSGVLPSLVMWGALGAGVVALLSFVIDFGLRSLGGDQPSRAFLVLVGLGPVVLLGLGIRLRSLLYTRIVCPLDRRFAQRRDVLAHATERLEREVAPDRVLATIRTALADMADGASVGLVRSADQPELLGATAELGPAVTRHLLEHPSGHLHREGPIQETELARELEALDAEILVPVRRGDTLYGALTLTGGVIDRDAVVAAHTLAEQLALKLENYGLFAVREKLEAELAEARRLASLGAFAAAIAHEIRTPLTSIQMNLQILQGKAALPPRDMEYFDIALEEAARLGTYIQEILDYAKPLQIHALPSDLREIADDTARSLEPLLADRNVRVAREHDPSLPAVSVDAQRIRQVLVNLIDNAAKASPEGAEVLLRTRCEDDRVVLEVVDRGRGIAADDLPKIFEPFFTTRPDGTGLGLAIAQKIVKAHGAEIVAESRAGEGATFRVVFAAPRAA